MRGNHSIRLARAGRFAQAGRVAQASRVARLVADVVARRCAVAVAGVVFLTAVSPAAAFDMPPDSIVDVGGRFDYRIEMGRDSSPFPWNYSSRSVRDGSRLMLDLSAGREPYGQLYLKGQAVWAEPRVHVADVRFEFEQGGYYWYRSLDDQRYQIRLFANERRYFTHSLSPAIVDDDVLTEFDDQYGLRHDGAADDFRWTALGGVLGDTWDESQKFYYLRAGWFGNLVQVSAEYLNQSPAPDTLQNHAVFRGELSAVYRYLGVVLSYAQSGFDDGALFFPSGNDGFAGAEGPYEGGSASSLPDEGAAFAEVRVKDLPVRGTGLWSVVYRYDAQGDAFTDELGVLRPGVTQNTVGLYYAAAKVAVNGGLEYVRSKRSYYDDKEQSRLAGRVRGLLANGFDAYLRGEVAKTTDELGVDTHHDFLHAAVGRHGRKVESRIHGMLADFADGPVDEVLGVEARFNFTATVSLYGRLVMSDRVSSRDAVYWRLEMRPTDWVFATFGYGRPYIGDDPYLLEDPDIGGMRGVSEAVYFATVRGDF
jgi:hypothetical protein